MNSSTELQPSDEQLVAMYRQAAPDARRALADELFSRHYTRVARWCYRFTGQQDSAADLAQEVFLKAHRHLESFLGTSRFSTWLYSIARNEWLNWLQRKRVAATDAVDAEALIDIPSPDPSPEDIATENSRARHVHDLLAATLDETERTVFTLHYGDDVPLDSITQALGLENASGAKAYIVSARRKLARAANRILARGGKP